jgi:hypothetical protein
MSFPPKTVSVKVGYPSKKTNHCSIGHNTLGRGSYYEKDEWGVAILNYFTQAMDKSQIMSLCEKVD